MVVFYAKCFICKFDLKSNGIFKVDIIIIPQIVPKCVPPVSFTIFSAYSVAIRKQILCTNFIINGIILCLSNYQPRVSTLFSIFCNLFSCLSLHVNNCWNTVIKSCTILFVIDLKDPFFTCFVTQTWSTFFLPIAFVSDIHRNLK